MPNIKALVIREESVLLVKENGEWKFPLLGCTSEKRTKSSSGDDSTRGPEFTGYLGGQFSDVEVDNSNLEFISKLGYRMYRVDIKSSLEPYIDKISWVNNITDMDFPNGTKQAIEKLVKEGLIK